MTDTTLTAHAFEAHHDDAHHHDADHKPAFFQRWRTDETIGTADGFARVTEDSENRALIEGDCHQRF